MVKTRKHLLIGIAIFAILFILGYFFDFNLSQAIADRTNSFALGVSVIALIPGWGMMAFIGGGFFSEAIKKEYKIYLRLLCFVFSAVLFVLSVHYVGREFFGVNGFYQALPLWVGYIFSTIVILGCFLLGFSVVKKSSMNNKWLLFLLICAAFIIIQMVGISALKSFFTRPRFITVNEYEVPFYSVFTRCADYKDYMAEFNLAKEEFKSFPSGHTAAAVIFVLVSVFLPLLDKKYENIYIKLYYLGLLWGLFVGFNRILAAAHFLTDISFGGFTVLLITFILNEIVIVLTKKNEKLFAQKSI